MPDVVDGLADRIAGVSTGLLPLVREAQATWLTRAAQAEVERPASGGSPGADGGGDVIVVPPGWRSFEDAFPTFYQFTNRPR